MLHNIKCIYLHCVFHGIRFKVNNEDWLSVRMAFFCIWYLQHTGCFAFAMAVWICRVPAENLNRLLNVTV